MHRQRLRGFVFDDDDDVFIERPGLPDEGMLCGYQNRSSTAAASSRDIVYIMYIWLSSEDNLRLQCPGCQRIERICCSGICVCSWGELEVYTR